MNRILVTACMVSLLGLVGSLRAGGDSAAVQEGESELRRIGPYEAITFNKKVLHDVKYEEDGDVFLQLLPDYKDKEIVVKISGDYFANYRQWAHGGYELVSPANQGKPSYGWTDYVNTRARFIEYWMDGEVFLHLKRTR